MENHSLSLSGPKQAAGVAYIAAFVGITYGFGIYVFSQLIPDMTRSLDFSNAEAGTITAAGQLGFVVFAFAGTWMSTRVNPVGVMVGSALLCSVSVFAVGFASNVWVVGALIFISTGTSASVYVPIAEVVASFTSVSRRGTSLGVISSGTTYGVGVGALLVPVFAVWDTWRGVWWTSGILGGILCVFAYRFFRRHHIWTEVWRLRVANKSTSASKQGSGLDLKTVFALILTWAGLIWIIKLMNGFSFMSFQTFLSPLLRDHGGQSVNYASGVWLTIAVCGAAAGLLVGAIGDRIGLRRTLFFCYGLFVVSSVIMANFQGGLMPYVGAALFAFSFYPIYGLVPAYVSTVASGAVATVIFGMANVFQGLGGILGNSVGGWFADSAGSGSDRIVYLYLVLGAGAAVLALATFALPSDRAPAPDGPRPSGALSTQDVGVTRP